jgi:hypothetical protein
MPADRDETAPTGPASESLQGMNPREVVDGLVARTHI